MWTDDEDLDERRGNWRLWRVAWWHKLSDVSEEFAVCIFKVEGNPEGQPVPVHSKLLTTFCRILRQWSNKRALKVTHCNNQLMCTVALCSILILLLSLIFLSFFNYSFFFLNSLFHLLYLLCLLSVILPVTSYSSSFPSSLVICPKPVRIKQSPLMIIRIITFNVLLRSLIWITKL